MTYKIRRVSAEEYLDDIARMDKKCLDGGNADWLERVDDWWIAFYGDEPAAYAGLSPSSKWANTGFLVRCGVMPDHRGNGLQRRLVHVRERRAHVHGWPWIVSYTRTNPESANNLARCGYKMFNPNKKWAPKDATYWRKCLYNSPGTMPS